MMRKYLLIFLLVFISSSAYAQLKLGIQLSPGLSFTRVKDEVPSMRLTSNGVGARMIAGLLADYGFKDNYYVSSGLFFVPKRVGLKDEGGVEETYRLQYLELPASIKLYTNEIALDTRIYFQVGITLDVNILDEPENEQTLYIKNFRFFDSNLLLGTGVEYPLGTSTLLFGGFTFRKGLVNVVKDQFDPTIGNIIIRNDMLTLDLGIKF